MKNLFTQSFWLWVVSKMLFIVVVFIAVVGVMGESNGRLSGLELGANMLLMVQAILMVITVVHDLSGKANLLKVVSGVLMIIIGLSILVVLLTVSKGGRSEVYFFGFPFTAWIVMIGIFDAMKIKRATHQS